jgi:hypothetical protein
MEFRARARSENNSALGFAGNAVAEGDYVHQGTGRVTSPSPSPKILLR